LAIIVITGFSAAYIAEIVRGGLQAVPKGQTEAAQASGMSAGSVQRLIVLPQALSAVIPAMVGQFIALFKDTSLLSIIGILEFLRVSDVANAQPDFLGKGLAPVTYLFVAIGYWAFAYTMSKESRRLEVRLGVGVR
ncbi:MAG: ABC transporter permease subunit, partial [Actinomycetia bacterium]|nr:ABC transporter permease subunit [Actinomycetes bacterium]